MENNNIKFEHYIKSVKETFDNYQKNQIERSKHSYSALECEIIEYFYNKFKL